jgi:hypothetical protein
MAYVGISECGCARSATVDDPEHRSQVRKDVASFMRHGDTIERHTAEWVRASLCLVNHKPACPHPGACPRLAEVDS